VRQRVSVVLVAALAVLGALASSASGAANPQHSSCFARFVSNQPAGDVGDSASSNARDPEARPLGFNVISFTALQPKDECFED
jgi:hypothetical protein